MNIRLGRWSRLLAPAYSTCWRCHTPWRFVHERTVEYELGSGQFALCVKCWAESDTIDRLKAHADVTTRWGDGHIEWPKIEAAVQREGDG